MILENQIKLFLVDDDAVYLALLASEFLDHGGFAVETFDCGENCLEKLSLSPDVIILDYQLDGVDKFAMNGIDTLDKIKANDPFLPVIMLSGQDKIEVAVNCMHHKAFDYVVKNETSFIRLQKIITHIFNIRKLEKELKWYMDRM